MNDLYSLLKQNSFNYSKKYLSRNLLNNQILDIFRDYFNENFDLKQYESIDYDNLKHAYKEAFNPEFTRKRSV